MPIYEIEVYELHTSKWRVSGDTPEQAVANFVNKNKGEMVDDSQELIETSDRSAPIEEMTITLDPGKLEAAGVELDDGRVPGIRDIEEVDDDEDDMVVDDLPFEAEDPTVVGSFGSDKEVDGG